MAVNQFTINFPGQLNIAPRLGHLYAPNNTLAQVTSAGYLDTYVKSQNFSILATDCILVCASDGTQFYKPIINAGTGSITLTGLP